MSVYNIDGEAIDTAYNISGVSLATVFDIDGNSIELQPTPPTPPTPSDIDYDNYTRESLFTVQSPAAVQGFDMYNDVLFVFTSLSGGRMQTFNALTGAIIQTNITGSVGHGDSASFSNSLYQASDTYPLIYVTADTTPAQIYVNRVTESSSTLIKTLLFPSSAGYYGAGAFDFANGICYLLAYKQNNYTSDNDGANTVVVSVWNINNLTNNGDDTYTPAFIRQYEIPFIYVMQGLTFYDNMIFVTSGGTGTAQYVYMLSPTDGEILHTITLPNTTEIEGVSLQSENDTAVMYVLQQGGVFTKYTFAKLN